MVVPPALHDIYRDKHPFVVVQKPAQVGVTEMNLTLALWAAANNVAGRGVVVYLMPTVEHVDRLSQRRVAKALEDSPALRQLVGVENDGPRPPQRVQLRSVGPGVIYFAGSEQARQYAGLDADRVILDEFDQMNEDVLPNALVRLRSSRAGQLRVTSTPTIPEFGVNGLMQRSDERHYQLKCPGCAEWVEPSFPTNVDFERGCVVCACGATLHAHLPGRWVPMRPDVGRIRGYQLNRLTLPNPPLEAMHLAASGTIGMRQEDFWRQDLGVPYVTDDARLTAADLDRCRVDRFPALAPGMKPDEVVMGVDVGQRAFWVVVRAFFGRRSFPVCVAIVEGEWEELDDLVKTFDVKWCVVDALPDTRGATRFQDRMRSRDTYVFLCYYGRQRDHDYVWDRPSTIHAARTLALDEMFDGFRRERSLLPMQAREIVEGRYYDHLQSLVRTTEPDDFGQPIPTYRHTRRDDFAHAETYVTLAASRWGTWNGWWE